MAVPSVATYSVAAKSAANTAILALIDAGTGAGKIALRDSADVLLGTVPLSDPGGTVNGTTGSLELDIAGDDEDADADGTIAYAEVADSDDTVILALPAQQGTTPVAGYLVMNTLAVVSGGTITIASAVIG